jgi:hypothetical protein
MLRNASVCVRTWSKVSTGWVCSHRLVYTKLCVCWNVRVCLARNYVQTCACVCHFCERVLIIISCASIVPNHPTHTRVCTWPGGVTFTHPYPTLDTASTWFTGYAPARLPATQLIIALHWITPRFHRKYKFENQRERQLCQNSARRVDAHIGTHAEQTCTVYCKIRRLVKIV